MAKSDNITDLNVEMGYTREKQSMSTLKIGLYK